MTHETLNATTRPKLLTEAEAADYLSVEPQTLCAWLRIPRHPASDSTRRRPRIPRDPGRLFQ